VKIDLAPGSPRLDRVGDTARAAEALGIDALWISETEHDPFISTSIALQATTRLTVGTGIAVAFARSPIVIAQSAFDLCELSGGRFALGLGTQVKAHVERRFGMEWSTPAPRLEEWLGAIRAAWTAWEYGERFRFESEHFNLSVMTPYFSPPRLSVAPVPGRARIPISIAGVGPGLARLSGRATEGFQAHLLNTPRYIDEVIEPAIREGEAQRAERAAAADQTAESPAPTRDLAEPIGRTERILQVFLVPAEDAARREEVRKLIAFYASTPSYRPFLDANGREAIGEQLSALQSAKRWDEMPGLIDDDFLAEVAVVAPWDGLGDALAARVEGVADRIIPQLPFEVDASGELVNRARWERIVSALRSA
jgi:probable F420-dependent oxidoreductase